MTSKKKSESLAEKISNLITAVPKTFGSDDEGEETKAKVVEYDDEIDSDNVETEFTSSSIRKKNANLLEETDKRYSGKKVSSKQIFNNDESSEESDDDEDEGENGNINDDDEATEGSAAENSNSDFDVDKEDDASSSDVEDKLNEKDSNSDEATSQADDEEESECEESESDNDFDDSIDLSNPLLRDRRSEKDIKTMSATNVKAEIEKGNCIREQLKLWENLLEMRIKLQKCLVNSNKMPQHDVYKNYESNNEYKKECNSVKNELGNLLNNLLELQSNLLSNYPETKDILAKGTKRKASEKNEESIKNDDLMDEEITSDEEIPSDTEDEMNDNEQVKDDVDEPSESENENKKGPVRKKLKLSEYENIIAKNHKAYTEYRNTVIQKWNDKTRIASGVISKGINQPAVKQIEFALANKDKLIKKTQLKRSEYEIIGKSSSTLEDTDGRRTQEYDTEIYDDDDFYHQLLRELIEYKSSDITDPIQLSKQWIQLQNMRSKMKRKIDTRATKGRRIRYNVHQKIVSFMAPITVNDTWTDHAKNELYSSLFGKIKSVSEEVKST